MLIISERYRCDFVMTLEDMRSTVRNLTREKVRLSPYLDFFRYPIKNQSELVERLNDLLNIYDDDHTRIFFELGYIWKRKDSPGYCLDYYVRLDEKSVDEDLLSLIKRENPNEDVLGLASVKIYVEKSWKSNQKSGRDLGEIECDCGSCINDLVNMSITTPKSKSC